MSPSRAWIAIPLAVVLAVPRPFFAAEEPPRTVHDVRIAGNERLDRDTLLYYATLKPGSAYDSEIARADFVKLWDQGLFEDLRLETEDTPDGGIDLIWHVVERPVLAQLSFKGNEGVVDEDIRKALKEHGIEFREGSPFGLGQVDRARGLIADQFRDKGYRFVTVAADVAPKTEAGRVVVFNIDEGSKVKIDKIEFEGNAAFPDKELRGALKKTKERGFMCTFNKHCVFNESNFKEDLEQLNEFYFDRGYINFAQGEPVIEAVGTGKDRRLHIRIPVSEGMQFKVGGINVEGNTAYSKDTLLSLNQLRVGAPFSRKLMNDSRTSMSEVYGVKGYFNVLIVPHFEPHGKDDVVDVTYKITENELYYVHRIAFKGNTTTKDKVIRRQLRIAEGDLFNTARFKRSLFRVYQLGYFKEPQPKIDPSAEDPTKLDVTIDLQEEGRNDIRIGGGVSGVEGLFGTLAFSTRNLFGSGNSATIDIQSGKRVKHYQISFLDPYLFDRPVSGGIDLFNRSIEYTDFLRKGTGGEVQLGWSFADFWFFRNSYRYEKVDQAAIDRFDANGTLLPKDPALVAQYTDHRKVSAVQPVLNYSSIDNPVRPWKGFRQVASLQYSGGFLGGSTNLIKPRLDSTLYVPLSGHVNISAHAEVSWVKGFGGLEVPLFERFFLGGDQSIRGFPVFSISPRAAGSEALLGGTKMAVLNGELQFRIANPLSLVLFADAGNSYRESEQFSFSNMRSSFGAEVRFWTPFLQAPLRLIYSYIPQPLVRNGKADSHTDFAFSIGTTF